MSSDIDTLKQAEKEQLKNLTDTIPLEKSQPQPIEARCGHAGSWVWGVTLVFLGAFWLLGGIFPFNWWAIFMLAPGLTKLSEALQIYWRQGRLSDYGGNALTWGVILTLMGGIFLFGGNPALFWPLILVGLGLSTLTRLAWR